MEKQVEYRNTIIYGGAFNPPTRAHQAILQACTDRAESLSADVWLLPSGNRADKTIEVSHERRIEMIQTLASEVVCKNVSVSINESELNRTEQTETYDTVQELARCYPDRSFIWVFGSDSVGTMQEWHGGEWMLDHLRMFIVDRPGSPIEALGRYASILPVETIATSSTEVRRRIQNHQSIHDLVSPKIEELLMA